MLDLLAKLLGPHRAVTVYAFLQTRALAIVVVLALLAGGALFALRGGDTLDHVAYIEARVLTTTPINGDRRNGIIADLRLPDGETLRLTETEGLIAGSLTDTACVELRRDRSGAPAYRLRHPRRCET